MQKELHPFFIDYANRFDNVRNKDILEIAEDLDLHWKYAFE